MVTSWILINDLPIIHDVWLVCLVWYQIADVR
jgi:hypothetical protein